MSDQTEHFDQNMGQDASRFTLQQCQHVPNNTESVKNTTIPSIIPMAGPKNHGEDDLNHSKLQTCHKTNFPHHNPHNFSSSSLINDHTPDKIYNSTVYNIQNRQSPSSKHHNNDAKSFLEKNYFSSEKNGLKNDENGTNDKNDGFLEKNIINDHNKYYDGRINVLSTPTTRLNSHIHAPSVVSVSIRPHNVSCHNTNGSDVHQNNVTTHLYRFEQTNNINIDRIDDELYQKNSGKNVKNDKEVLLKIQNRQNYLKKKLDQNCEKNSKSFSIKSSIMTDNPNKRERDRGYSHAGNTQDHFLNAAGNGYGQNDANNDDNDIIFESNFEQKYNKNHKTISQRATTASSIRFGRTTLHNHREAYQHSNKSFLNRRFDAKSSLEKVEKETKIANSCQKRDQFLTNTAKKVPSRTIYTQPPHQTAVSVPNNINNSLNTSPYQRIILSYRQQMFQFHISKAPNFQILQNFQIISKNQNCQILQNSNPPAKNNNNYINQSITTIPHQHLPTNLLTKPNNITVTGTDAISMLTDLIASTPISLFHSQHREFNIINSTYQHIYARIRERILDGLGIYNEYRYVNLFHNPHSVNDQNPILSQLVKSLQQQSNNRQDIEYVLSQLCTRGGDVGIYDLGNDNYGNNIENINFNLEGALARILINSIQTSLVLNKTTSQITNEMDYGFDCCEKLGDFVPFPYQITDPLSHNRLKQQQLCHVIVKKPNNSIPFKTSQIVDMINQHDVLKQQYHQHDLLKDFRKKSFGRCNLATLLYTDNCTPIIKTPTNEELLLYTQSRDTLCGPPRKAAVSSAYEFIKYSVIGREWLKDAVNGGRSPEDNFQIELFHHYMRVFGHNRYVNSLHSGYDDYNDDFDVKSLYGDDGVMLGYGNNDTNMIDTVPEQWYWHQQSRKLHYHGPIRLSCDIDISMMNLVMDDDQDEAGKVANNDNNNNNDNYNNNNYNYNFHNTNNNNNNNTNNNNNNETTVTMDEISTQDIVIPSPGQLKPGFANEFLSVGNIQQNLVNNYGILQNESNKIENQTNLDFDNLSNFTNFSPNIPNFHQKNPNLPNNFHQNSNVPSQKPLNLPNVPNLAHSFDLLNPSNVGNIPNIPNSPNVPNSHQNYPYQQHQNQHNHKSKYIEFQNYPLLLWDNVPTFIQRCDNTRIAHITNYFPESASTNSSNFIDTTSTMTENTVNLQCGHGNVTYTPLDVIATMDMLHDTAKSSTQPPQSYHSYHISYGTVPSRCFYLNNADNDSSDQVDNKQSNQKSYILTQYSFIEYETSSDEEESSVQTRNSDSDNGGGGMLIQKMNLVDEFDEMFKSNTTSYVYHSDNKDPITNTITDDGNINDSLNINNIDVGNVNDRDTTMNNSSFQPQDKSCTVSNAINSSNNYNNTNGLYQNNDHLENSNSICYSNDSYYQQYQEKCCDDRYTDQEQYRFHGNLYDGSNKNQTKDYKYSHHFNKNDINNNDDNNDSDDSHQDDEYTNGDNNRHCYSHQDDSNSYDDSHYGNSLNSYQWDQNTIESYYDSSNQSNRENYKGGQQQWVSKFEKFEGADNYQKNTNLPTNSNFPQNQSNFQYFHNSQPSQHFNNYPNIESYQSNKILEDYLSNNYQKENNIDMSYHGFDGYNINYDPYTSINSIIPSLDSPNSPFYGCYDMINTDYSSYEPITPFHTNYNDLDQYTNETNNQNEQNFAQINNNIAPNDENFTQNDNFIQNFTQNDNFIQNFTQNDNFIQNFNPVDKIASDLSINDQPTTTTEEPYIQSNQRRFTTRNKKSGSVFGSIDAVQHMASINHQRQRSKGMTTNNSSNNSGRNINANNNSFDANMNNNNNNNNYSNSSFDANMNNNSSFDANMTNNGSFHTNSSNNGYDANGNIDGSFRLANNITHPDGCTALNVIHNNNNNNIDINSHITQSINHPYAPMQFKTNRFSQNELKYLLFPQIHKNQIAQIKQKKLNQQHQFLQLKRSLQKQLRNALDRYDGSSSDTDIVQLSDRLEELSNLEHQNNDFTFSYSSCHQVYDDNALNSTLSVFRFVQHAVVSCGNQRFERQLGQYLSKIQPCGLGNEQLQQIQAKHHHQYENNEPFVTSDDKNYLKNVSNQSIISIGAKKYTDNAMNITVTSHLNNYINNWHRNASYIIQGNKHFQTKFPINQIHDKDSHPFLPNHIHNNHYPNANDQHNQNSLIIDQNAHNSSHPLSTLTPVIDLIATKHEEHYIPPFTPISIHIYFSIISIILLSWDLPLPSFSFFPSALHPNKFSIPYDQLVLTEDEFVLFFKTLKIIGIDLVTFPLFYQTQSDIYVEPSYHNINLERNNVYQDDRACRQLELDRFQHKKLQFQHQQEQKCSNFANFANSNIKNQTTLPHLINFANYNSNPTVEQRSVITHTDSNSHNLGQNNVSSAINTTTDNVTTTSTTTTTTQFVPSAPSSHLSHIHGRSTTQSHHNNNHTTHFTQFDTEKTKNNNDQKITSIFGLSLSTEKGQFETVFDTKSTQLSPPVNLTSINAVATTCGLNIPSSIEPTILCSDNIDTTIFSNDTIIEATHPISDNCNIAATINHHYNGMIRNSRSNNHQKDKIHQDGVETIMRGHHHHENGLKFDQIHDNSPQSLLFQHVQPSQSSTLITQGHHVMPLPTSITPLPTSKSTSKLLTNNNHYQSTISHRQSHFHSKITPSGVDSVPFDRYNDIDDSSLFDIDCKPRVIVPKLPQSSTMIVKRLDDNAINHHRSVSFSDTTMSDVDLWSTCGDSPVTYQIIDSRPQDDCVMDKKSPMGQGIEPKSHRNNFSKDQFDENLLSNFVQNNISKSEFDENLSSNFIQNNLELIDLELDMYLPPTNVYNSPIERPVYNGSSKLPVLRPIKNIFEELVQSIIQYQDKNINSNTNSTFELFNKNDKKNNLPNHPLHNENPNNYNNARILSHNHPNPHSHNNINTSRLNEQYNMALNYAIGQCHDAMRESNNLNGDFSPPPVPLCPDNLPQTVETFESFINHHNVLNNQYISPINRATGLRPKPKRPSEHHCTYQHIGRYTPRLLSELSPLELEVYAQIAPYFNRQLDAENTGILVDSVGLMQDWIKRCEINRNYYQECNDEIEKSFENIEFGNNNGYCFDNDTYNNSGGIINHNHVMNNTVINHNNVMNNTVMNDNNNNNTNMNVNYHNNICTASSFQPFQSINTHASPLSKQSHLHSTNSINSITSLLSQEASLDARGNQNQCFLPSKQQVLSFLMDELYTETPSRPENVFSTCSQQNLLQQSTTINNNDHYSYDDTESNDDIVNLAIRTTSNNDKNTNHFNDLGACSLDLQDNTCSNKYVSIVQHTYLQQYINTFMNLYEDFSQYMLLSQKNYTHFDIVSLLKNSQK